MRGADPLNRLLAFRDGVERERRHLFKLLPADAEFATELRATLGEWLRDFEVQQGRAPTPSAGRGAASGVAALEPEPPARGPEPKAADSPAARLLERAGERIDAGAHDVALAFIDEVRRAEPDPLTRATVLFARGYALDELGRSDDAIAAYDDLLARFGSATELPLREQVARALFNKGFRLGALGRNDAQVSVMEDVLSRFGMSDESMLADAVGRALDALTRIAFEQAHRR